MNHSALLIPLLALILGMLPASAKTARRDSEDSQPKHIGHPNDPAARKFLEEAEERGTSWNGFPGFSADITVYFNGKTHRGELVIPASRKIKLELGDADARKWALGVLNSIATTSSRKEFEERYQNVGVVFGKDDLHPLGQLVELRGDPYQSKFRVLDGEVRYIERVTAEQRISLHILSVERDQEDRKRSRSFVANYIDKKSGALVRSEAIEDRRVIVDGYVLPEDWKETSVTGESTQTHSIALSNHALLPTSAVESAASTKR
jgi:hypothetical protein